MRVIKFVIIGFFLIHLGGCIDEYSLDGSQVPSPKIVIEGNLTDACGNHEIRVSRSSTIEHAFFIPLSDCNVLVESNNGEIYHFLEDAGKKGSYIFENDGECFNIGKEYRLVVKTTDGKVYESSYEIMLPSPPIDSLYFERRNLEMSNLVDTIKGIQLLLDFRASEYFGHYYRWSIEETFEFHSTWPKRSYISTTGKVTGSVDYSTYVCYKTEELDDIFTLSTINLNKNEYIKAELNFVSDKTQRLMYNYSILVKQYALTEDAYNYWENIRKNNRVEGGLFSTQPSMVRGNITNVTDSSEIVLGYFTVSSESSRRLVVDSLEGLDFDDVFYCSPIPIELIIPEKPRPMYLVDDVKDDKGNTILAWGFTECFDCTLLGGQLNKPDFFK